MKKVKRLIVLFIVIIITFLLPVQIYAARNDTNEIVNLDDNDKAKIEKFIEEQMDKGMLPGMSVVIVQGDKTIYQKGFGYSDLELKQPVTSNTLFEIGSNSKAFTGLGILKLQNDGLINMNAPITNYIPWLTMNYEGKATQITVEEFLHQTSGIPFSTIDKIPILEDENAIEETVKTLVGIELDSKPGDKFQYATINYDVLGLLIEKVTGVTYEDYIKENVLNPMGLTNTYLYKNQAVNEHIAQGYKIGFLKPRLYDAPSYKGNKPAGYVISCGEDMAKWLKIQMNTFNDSKFNKDLIEQSHEPNRRVNPLGDGSSYAAGWFVYQKGGGEISHDGSNPNYSSFMVFRPEERIGIAVLSNMSSGYITATAQGINEILQGNDYNKEIKDLNKSVDRICSLIICIAILIIISTIYLIIKTFKEILKKERTLNRKGIKGILKVIISVISILALCWCIYLIPYILYNGVSWRFAFVWLSKSIEVALELIYLCILLLYMYYLAISFYKKKYEKSILLLSLLSAISGFGNALIIFTINIAINSSNELKIKLLVYFFLGLILYVYGQKIIRGKLIDITNGIVYSKRMEIINCLLKYPYNQFEEIKKGRIESTLNNDTETISRFVNILISGVTSVITLIFCFVYLGFINRYALLLSITIIVFIASIYYLVCRYANRIGEESRDLQNIFFEFINSLICGFKELTLNEKRTSEFEVDMEKSCNKYRVKKGQAALAFANMFVLGELLFTIAIGFVVFIFPIILKNLESTSVASYVFILLYMTGPVNGILDTIPNAIEVKISLKRINNLLNQITPVDNKDYGDKHLKLEYYFSLKLNEIQYKYNEDGGQKFKVGPINYEFKSGEIVFITGGNGSGKSTLAKLLTGLYPPGRGYITLNNNKVSEKMLSENCSTVFSDFYLFQKFYGIDYKNKEKEIQEYLQRLQLDNKVQIEDGQFNTTKLSTGQKKRLALLVMYLEDRPIYLFDEWAADQDPEFRQFFYDTLLPELKEKGKCVIAITHDEHYFNRADKVIKMELGKIQNI